MTNENIAIVVGPNLLRPRQEDANYLYNMKIMADVVVTLLQNYDSMFEDLPPLPGAKQRTFTTAMPSGQSAGNTFQTKPLQQQRSKAHSILMLSPASVRAVTASVRSKDTKPQPPQARPLRPRDLDIRPVLAKKLLAQIDVRVVCFRATPGAQGAQSAHLSHLCLPNPQ